MTASLLRGVCAAVIGSALPFEACKEVKCDISRLLLPSPKQRLQACLARLMQGHCKQLSIDQHQKSVTLCFGMIVLTILYTKAFVAAQAPKKKA